MFLTGAEAIDLLVKAKHWQAFLAGSLLTAVWVNLAKLKATPHKEFARARAFILYVTGVICIILIVAEYWPAIAIVLSWLYGIMDSAHEYVLDMLESI